MTRWLVLLLVPWLLVGCQSLVDPPGLAAYNEGVQHMGRGERDLAEQQFKIALQQQPQLAEAHLNLGLIYLQNAWLDGAEDQTRQAIALLEQTKKTTVLGASYEQTLSIAYGNLGLVQMSRAGDAATRLQIAIAKGFESDALASLTKAVQLDPSNSRAQATLPVAKQTAALLGIAQP